MKMAANNSREKTTKVSAENKLSTYSLIIGILAVFSLVILILLIFVPLSSSTEDVLNSTENLVLATWDIRSQNRKVVPG